MGCIVLTYSYGRLFNWLQSFNNSPDPNDNW